VTLRQKVLTYLIALHVIILTAGIFVLMEHYRLWIVALEILLAASMIIGIYLIRGYHLHLGLLSSGAEFIREQDFTHTFNEVGSTDLNKLVLLYNEMIRRLRDERLRGQEQQMFLEKIINASPTGLLTLDMDCKVDIINPAAVQFVGLSEEEQKGKRLADLQSSIATDISQLGVGSTVVLHLNGGRRLKCTHSQFYDTGFERSFFLLVELTKEIWKSEKRAYETLIRILSHEVSNTVGATQSILQSTLAYANQLKPDDREDFESAVNVAINRTHHLDKFMRSYADVVRLPEPSRDWVDPVDLVNRILYLIRPECEARNIKLESEFDSQFGRVSLDVAQIEQVLMNLLKNALEAIEKDGLIRIALIREGSGRYLSVEDNGTGLSENARSQLFTPFFSTKKNGQGIGLTLVHEILSRHQFEFSLDSLPEQPTRFLIAFGR
jgi:two-component system nitrogen regulation sensor histidine kinase NtrY